MLVYLVNFRDGVARACRVSWSMGVTRILLVNSDWPSGKYLFSAKRLKIETAENIPSDVLLLETTAKRSIEEVEWTTMPGIAVGGAGFSFPVALLSGQPSARIPSRRPCLIGDQAIAIALWEWRKKTHA